MSYLRGDYYLWADGEDRLHIWAADGGDHWQDSVWAEDPAGQRRSNGGGVSIPRRVLDEYVMLRFAQLVKSGEAQNTVDRALRHGNVGGDALKEMATAIRDAIERLERT